MVTKLPLNTGTTIPALGLGTWQSPKGEVAKAVHHALKSGYRHIDTAWIYGNEEEVGSGMAAAISEGICKREDIFLTTKLWCTFLDRVEEGLERSLKNLQTDYVDLYLMHWPVAMNSKGNSEKLPSLPDGTRDIDLSHWHVDTWKSMEALTKSPKTKSQVRAIGVANYSVPFLEELLEHATVVPAANQIENHPQLPQQEIVDFCQKRNIHITAYSPFGSTGTPLFENKIIKEIAEIHNSTPSGVLLGYHLARDASVLAKSITPSRIEQNANIAGLQRPDIEKLNTIVDTDGLKRYVYPAFNVNMGFPDKNSGRQLKEEREKAKAAQEKL